MSIEIFVALFICIILVMMLVYGRMEYYRAQAETRLETIEELQRQNMLLSYINDDKAARYTNDNF